MSRRRLLLLVLLGSVGALLLVLLAAILLPQPALIGLVDRSLVVSSRLEAILGPKKVHFASFVGDYVFPYDFFSGEEEFQSLRRRHGEVSALADPQLRSLHEVAELAVGLGITTLRTSRFFVIAIRAKAGLDFERGLPSVQWEEGRPVLYLPPVTITEFQILDEAKRGFPDFPVSPSLWGRTIAVLRPLLEDFITRESSLMETAQQQARRHFRLIAEALGLPQPEIRFASEDQGRIR